MNDNIMKEATIGITSSDSKLSIVSDVRKAQDKCVTGGIVPQDAVDVLMDIREASNTIWSDSNENGNAFLQKLEATVNTKTLSNTEFEIVDRDDLARSTVVYVIVEGRDEIFKVVMD